MRRIQGLSARSFAQGSGTGISVRAGTTTGVAASDDIMTITQADTFQGLPITAVTTQPRNCSRPPVSVPQEAIDNQVEGTLRMLLELDAHGRVTSVSFTNHLGYGTEGACREAALKIRCRPARQGDTAVAVTGMPHRCTIKALD